MSSCMKKSQESNSPFQACFDYKIFKTEMLACSAGRNTRGDPGCYYDLQVTTITVSRVLPHSVLSTLLSHSICCVDTVAEIPTHSAFLLQRNLRLHLVVSSVYCFLLLTKAINSREGKES